MPYKQDFLNWISTARPSPHFLYITEDQKRGTKFWQQIVYTWKMLLINWNFHIKNEHRSLEGWNPNFNFHVRQNLT